MKFKFKKPEWSKIFTGLTALIIGIYGIYCGARYYQLCKLAIELGGTPPDSALAVICVTVVIGSLISYCLYQFGLKNSRNKYGVDSEGNPFKSANIHAQDEVVTDFYQGEDQ